MAVFVESPPFRWAYTFLRRHVEQMREPVRNPVRHRSILFRFFSELTFAEFFNRSRPGMPWFIDVSLERSRAGAQSDRFRASQLGEVILESEAPVALLSPPGSGKTTLQLYSFFGCLTERNPLCRAGYVPVFVSSHRLGASLAHQLQASLGLGDFSVPEIERYLAESSRLLFLFDLNRVPYHEQTAFARRITEELAQSDLFRARGHRLILAARNRPELANQLFLDGYDLWSILPLPPEQAEAFLEDALATAPLAPGQWELVQQLLARHGELLLNPFHLSLITILVASRPASVREIDSTGRLFKLVTEQILEQELPAWLPLDNGRALTPSPVLSPLSHPVDRLLQHLAHDMVERGVRSLNLETELLECMQRLFNEYAAAPWWPRRHRYPLTSYELEPLLREHALFRVSQEGTHLIWLHDTFQDFFAAKWLAYDSRTGHLRVTNHDHGTGGAEEPSSTVAAALPSEWIGALETYSRLPGWTELIPFVTDLMQPAQFEALVKHWCLAQFDTDAKGYLKPREESLPPAKTAAPNRFVLRHLVPFLERLEWTEALDKLVQQPFLRAKMELLGHDSILPDLLACLRVHLRHSWQHGNPVRVIQDYTRLAVARATVFEQTEGGAILRDYLDGTASTYETRRRIENLPEGTSRFFHMLLLAEAIVRRHSTAERRFDPGVDAQLTFAEQTLREAFDLPVSAPQVLQHPGDPLLRADLLECWAQIHGSDVDPGLFPLFFDKLQLGKKYRKEVLSRIVELGGRGRVLRILQRIAPREQEKRHYKQVMREVVTRYAEDGLYKLALEALEQAATSHRDDLRGVIVELAISNRALEWAQRIVPQIEHVQLRSYLEAALAGHRAVNPQRLHRREPVKLQATEGERAGDLEGLSFFVKRRTDLLEALGEREALAGRPPRSRANKRGTPLNEADRLTWLARWAYYHHLAGESAEAQRRLREARHHARQLPEIADWLFHRFELLRHLVLVGEPQEAERIFKRLTALVRQGERDSGNRGATNRQALRMLLAEQFAWWGFGAHAERLLAEIPKETWYTRGRFYAHTVRFLLAQHGPAAALAWYRELPHIQRPHDARWHTWMSTLEALEQAWQALAEEDVSHCLQHLDEARAQIAGYRGRREVEAHLAYFRGQMKANLILFAAHHPELKPLAEEEVREVESQPMRAFCVGHMLRLYPEGLPRELIDRGLEGFRAFERPFFRGKIRVMKHWAESLAELEPATYAAWLERFLFEVAQDARLLRFLLPDVTWLLVRRTEPSSQRAALLDTTLALGEEANQLYADAP